MDGSEYKTLYTFLQSKEYPDNSTYISLFSSPNDRYREDIDTIIYNIYNIYTILEHRKPVS
jgi:hypothetical protein